MKSLGSATTLGQTGIRAMFDLALEYPNAISFCLGQPDFPTPKRVNDAAIKAIERGETKYTANAGILPLREAVSRKMWEVDQVKYDPETEIMITNGGMQGLSMAFTCLLDPGDEVIICNPCYANYEMIIRLYGGVPVPVAVREETGFSLEPDKLEAAITPKTKAILLNTPTNPTGGYESKENQIALAEVIKKNDLWVVFDQVYKNLLYNENDNFFSMASLPGMKERTIVVDSVSKTYSMTGWRVGFVCGPQNVIEPMPNLQELILACINTPAQYAAIEALNIPDEELDYMKQEYIRRRNYMVERINGIDKLSARMPLGAFYVFMNIKQTGMSSQEFAIKLLREKEVVVSPGDCFGSEGEGYVRLSYATSLENIEKGMDRIQKFVAEHII